MLAETEPWLSGETEIDESYFGASRKGKCGRGAAGKVPIFGFSRDAVMLLGSRADNDHSRDKNLSGRGPGSLASGVQADKTLTQTDDLSPVEFERIGGLR